MTGNFNPIGWAVGAAQDAFNWQNAERNTLRERRWNQADYAQQRRDAQADWERNNSYNTPEQQMQRLREAGLNPNLVYGKGADNTAQAINQTKMTPSKSLLSPPLTRNYLMESAQLNQTKAQTDNLYKQNAVLAQEALLKAANIAQVGSITAKSKFDLQQAQALNETTIAQARANLTSTEQKTYLDAERFQNESTKLQSDLKVAAQNIAESKVRAAKTDEERKNAIETRNILKNEAKVKEFEAKLAQMNLSKNDPLAARVLVKMAEEAASKVSTYIDKDNSGYLNQNSKYWDNYKKHNK